jgi:hypothetical protein
MRSGLDVEYFPVGMRDLPADMQPHRRAVFFIAGPEEVLDE